MLIDRTTEEDLTMLELFVSKLEEVMTEKGIKFFEYSVNEEEIEHVCADPEYAPSYRDSSDWSTKKDIAGKLRPLKRVTLKYHSKAVFSSQHMFDSPVIADDGIYTASALNIEWDYFTNVFTVHVTNETYEKEDKQNAQVKRVRKSDSDSAHIAFDFGFKNRREIQLMKVRLGKLYAKLIRDKKLEQELFYRKKLTDITAGAFPDIFDSLILGG